MSLRLEDHVFRVLENQAALFEYLGEHSWGFDMDTGQLSFTAAEADEWLASCPVQLVGTESEADGSWLWAWANAQSHIPPSLLRGVEQVRQEGERLGDALFSEPKHSLSHAHFGAELAIRSAGFLGLPTYYACPYEGGVLFTVLEELPEPARKARTSMSAIRAIQAGISALTLNHREAVYAYLGAPAAGGENEAAWRVGDGLLRVTFDGVDRVTGMETAPG
jgi:hypothetical protein